MTARLVHGLNAALLVALVGGSAVAWPGLPAEIPIHFGPSGEPDRWADTTLLTWFGLPALAVVLTLALYLAARVLPSRPRWLNMPDRARFLALPEDARGPVYRHVRTVLYLAATVLLVVFGLLQIAVYREALGTLGAGYIVAVLIVAVGSGPVLAIFAIVGLQRTVDEAWRKERSGEAGTDAWPAPP